MHVNFQIILTLGTVKKICLKITVPVLEVTVSKNSSTFMLEIKTKVPKNRY